MKRILLRGMDTFNYGDRAMLKGAVGALRKHVHDISLTMFIECPEIDRKEYQGYDIELIKMPWRKSTPQNRQRRIVILYDRLCALFTLFNCILHRLFKPFKVSIPIVGGIHKYDIYIEFGADIHSPYSGFFPFFFSFYQLLLFIIIQKPFIVYTETLGPFEGKVIKAFAKFIFRKASLITTRDDLSVNYVRAMGIANLNVHASTDAAFLFVHNCRTERVDEIVAAEGINQDDQPLVVLTPSSLIYKYGFPGIKDPEEKRRKYEMLMANITDYIVENYAATVILISHVVSPEYSDTPIRKEIYKKVRNKNRVKLIRDDYTVDELKAIEGRCQMLIGCRMHSTIASISMHIPTIAIAYSHKYGVVSPILDPEGCIVDIRNSDYDQLLSQLCSKIDYVWENKEQIAKKLGERMPLLIEKAELSAKLVKEVFDELYGA
ncbi:polysaccharide pyruvyl transferase family protein [Chloroflexota bacterium]